MTTQRVRVTPTEFAQLREASDRSRWSYGEVDEDIWWQAVVKVFGAETAKAMIGKDNVLEVCWDATEPPSPRILQG